MSVQSGGHRLRLSKLNDQLTCKLCGGYFVDATTIIECLHSFCRSCIVKYLESNKYCPICEVQVHKSRPLLNIRPDHTLQDIVYKLVPGCYQNEMRCRREFYTKHPEACSQATSPEARGEPTESHIYSPDESLSLSLEYFNPCAKENKETSAKPLLKRYLRCPAAVTVFHLQKLIRAKYGLTDAHRVDVMYKEEALCANYTLMDVMYIYHWRRKVPVHLSYRIFESSPKRMKFSEDNDHYKSSLSRCGIDSIELREEKSTKREWKEVQLKISETGVMSITDISDQRFTRDTRLEDTVATLESVKASIENTSFSETQEKREETRNASANTEELCNLKNSLDRPDNEKNSKEKVEEGKTVPTSKETEREAKDRVDNNNVEVKAILQKSVQSVEATQITEKDEANSVDGNNVDDADHKQTRNNNNNNTIVAESNIETRKQNAKNEMRVANAGSKIDALSAKLQFQPKIGQVGNTYSKKITKDKKTVPQMTKKTDGKTIESTKPAESKNSVDGSNSRANCASVGNKSLVPCSARTIVQKPGAENATEAADTPERVPKVPSGVTSAVNTEQSKKEPREKDTQSPGHDRCPSQEQKPPESKINSLERIPVESTPRVCGQTNPAPQKSVYEQSMSDNLAPVGLPMPISASTSIPTSTINQTTSTFPYTVQDLVNNAMLKNSLKNLVTSTTCSMPDNPMFSMQSPINVPASLKNNYIGQGTNSSKQTHSKVNFEITGVYSAPPCPDAIPISLMKPTIRKNELITKGSNLNEICAKIGASASKINDICAKIGESTKEKTKAEARSKSDIPDLLKIGRKGGSASNMLDTSRKQQQHASIPHVPVYAPNSSAITTESKSVYSSVKDSLRATSLVSVTPVTTPHAMQKLSSSATKKQNQAVGYKTLRDPPRCWNPTLSTNNYVAVKNQSKETQNQIQQATLSERSKQPIQSKPAKIFKQRNMPRYLGNPASGVKPMYGIGNENKEKEQSTSTTTTTTSSRNASLSMMKIDPKTLSPIVSTVNSPIVSPPPYSPSARNYQSSPFSRDICRNTGSPISPKNSPVNMLSTNPFIPSPTPNTNPRLIYSHFPPPFSDASRFPNTLIRSPIGIPPPSAFHSSLPPSVNKLYQRSSYIPQTTGFSPVSQPPTVQRIPPSTYSSPKSPKTTSLTAISPTSFGLTKPETQLSTTTATTTTSLESSGLLLPENVPQEDLSAFNLSKTGGFSKMDGFPETVQCSKPNSSATSSSVGQSRNAIPTTKTKTEGPALSASELKEEKEGRNEEAEKELAARSKEESSPSSRKTSEKKRTSDSNDASKEKKDKPSSSQVNGDVVEYFGGNANNENKKEAAMDKELTERPKQNNAKTGPTGSENVVKQKDDSKKEESCQGKELETQGNKARTS